MISQRTSVICTIFYICCLLMASCATPPASSPPHTARATRVPASIAVSTATMPPPTPTPQSTAPASYTSHVILRGVGRPDDMAFDQQGRLLFSDVYNGTITRINSDGTTSVLLRNLAGPEGIVVQPDGTLIISEQRTNRILKVAPGSQTPTVLRALPGIASTASCKDGIDSIVFDPTQQTLILPDSPTGVVYRMSLDGQNLTQLAAGLKRPVGADVDQQGNVYVADECGGSVWRITPGGQTTQLGGFSMPDDVALDTHGNLYVIDLATSRHALIRVNLASGQHETLASTNFSEPQGLLIDKQDNIFVSDDNTNTITEFTPA